MNAIEYYCNFLKVIMDRSCPKGTKNDLKDGFISYNNYLYIYDDELKGPEIITIIENQYQIKYLPGRLADKDIYMIFICYDEYILTLELDLSYGYDDLCLHFHNDEHIITYTYYNVRPLIKFLKLDKLNEALGFISVTLRIMYNIEMSINTDAYVSKYKSLMKKSVDCFMHETSIIDDSGSYHYLICSKEESYLNVNDGIYTFDKTEKGTYLGTIYYFEIDSLRSIFIFMDHRKAITISFYKDDEIVIEQIGFMTVEPLLKMMFHLLGKDNIYRYLKQIQFFDKDVFYSNKFKKLF